MALIQFYVNFIRANIFMRFYFQFYLLIILYLPGLILFLIDYENLEILKEEEIFLKC